MRGNSHVQLRSSRRESDLSPDCTHQALSCGNQPPHVAFPDLPSLPKVPDLIDPDAWLPHVDGQHFVRKIRANGSIVLDDVSYYIKQPLAGHYVDISIDASARELIIWHQHQPLKRLAIKGLQKTLIPFEQFVMMMGKLARSEQRRQERAKWHAQGGHSWHKSSCIALSYHAHLTVVLLAYPKKRATAAYFGKLSKNIHEKQEKQKNIKIDITPIFILLVEIACFFHTIIFYHL
jgi:hypothetical protein